MGFGQRIPCIWQTRADSFMPYCRLLHYISIDGSQAVQATAYQDSSRHDIYICRTGDVSRRRKCSFYTRRANLSAKPWAVSYNWILIPLGTLMGFFVVAAEPAVHILNNQVWEMTAGAISKAMMASLSIGVALSIGIAMAESYFM